MIEIRDNLIKKTVSNLEADVTRKGTWAYQNAIALESIESSDAYLDDLAKQTTAIRADLVAAKESLVNGADIKKVTAFVPSRHTGNGDYLKELKNGEIAQIVRNEKGSFEIFVSKDGKVWTSILNKTIDVVANEYIKDIQGVIDVEYINGDYVIAWVTNDGVYKLNSGLIKAGQIVNRKVEKESETEIVGVRVEIDPYDYPMFIVSAKDANGIIQVSAIVSGIGEVPLVFDTSVNSYFGGLGIDKNIVYFAIQSGKTSGVISLDLNDLNAPVVENFVLNGESDEGYILADFKDGVLRALRKNAKGFKFYVETSEFSLFDVTVTSELQNVILGDVIVVGNKVTENEGLTWKLLPFANLVIDTNYSTLKANNSFYKNFIVGKIGTDVSPIQIFKLEDVLNTDEVAV